MRVLTSLVSLYFISEFLSVCKELRNAISAERDMEEFAKRYYREHEWTSKN